MSNRLYFPSGNLFASLDPEFIFVFGSNRAGIHGSGAAWFARNKFGARMGVGEGLTGYCYALPTKDGNIETLPISEITKHVSTFVDVARILPEYKFVVTRVGCGLAGYEDKDIAPLFRDAPDNCIFDEAWKPYLE